MPIFSSSVITAVLTALISGFWFGFYASHQMDKAEISRMSNDITAANTLAAAALKIETDKVAAATKKAIETNADLDKAHEAYIKTANDYDHQLDDVRLYSKRRESCSGSTTASVAAGISEDSAGEAGLSEELDRLVKEKARIADEAADYADKAYQFAALKNCGIAD